MADKTFSARDRKSVIEAPKKGAPATSAPAVSRNRPRPPRGGFVSAGAAGAMMFSGSTKDEDADAS